MIEQRSDVSTLEVSDCAHHWQIETPAGESSRGNCKNCGATKDFLNYSKPRTMARSVKPQNGHAAAATAIAAAAANPATTATPASV